MTFTNRAAAELRERIISLVGEGGRDVVAGTFHSLCARVLRADGEAIGIGRRFVIYDTDDQGSLMKQILREEDMPLTGEFRPSVVLGCDQPGQERDARSDVPRRQRVEPPRADDRAPRDALPGTPAQVERARLRRPAARGRAPVRGGARRPGQVPGALALPPRRRVPGHQPRAVPVGPRPRRAPSQPVRGRRRRPVDLLVAWRRPAQHPRLRARLAGHRRGQARAELPVHPAHPRCRPCGRIAQHRAQGQEAVDGQRGRRPHPALRGVQRGRGGRVDRPPGRGPGRRARERA